MLAINFAPAIFGSNAAGLIFGSSAVLGLEPIRIRLVQTASFLLQGDPDYWLTHITSSVVGLMSVSLTVMAFVLGSLIWPDGKPSPAEEED